MLVDGGLLSTDQLVSLVNGTAPSRFPLTRDAVALAARLSRGLDASNQAILFSGVTDDDGAAEVASQVALTFARMDRGDVLLLDANNRHASLHVTFGIKQAPGFSDVLSGHCKIEEATFTSAVPHLCALPAGSSRPDLTKFLLSGPGESLLRQARERYLFVVMHGPPLLSSPEGSLLAVRADAVVTVVAAGRHTTDQLVQIKRTLDGLKVRSLGVVLTEKGPPLSNHQPPARAQ
jgi:tyrosine-protein kinase Etk/Wzc